MTEQNQNLVLVREKRKLVEFSKLVLALVLLTYFAGVIIGSVIVLTISPEQLGVFLGFIGAPTAVAIGFYAWKAKAENLRKIGAPIELANENSYSSHSGMQSLLQVPLTGRLETEGMGVDTTTRPPDIPIGSGD